MENRRRYNRFSATAFLNRPVQLSPLPPYFGRVVTGKLIDLSAGGMAIFIDEIIPQGTKLELVATFPDGFKIECVVEIKHMRPREGKYLHGFEFLNLPTASVEKIEKMSNHYIDCESRITARETDVCKADCAFFSMCSKPQKSAHDGETHHVLDLSFKTFQETSLK